MNRIGIIAEYNPLHNGHIYHINMVKKMFPGASIVLVMSGNFTESGNVSIINKWAKTDLALTYGVDLVIELPYAFATESADVFALGSIAILNELKCDALVFGSESDDIDLLYSLAQIQLKPEFGDYVKEYMDTGISYPMALNLALNRFKPLTALGSNDILGLSYVKEIIRTNSNIKPYTIKRTNDFNSVTADTSIASARSIRKLIKDGKDFREYVPSNTYNYLLKDKHYMDQYFSLLKYKIVTEPDLSIYETVDEGIENRIYKYINDVKDYEELIDKVKNKRFSRNKLTRMFCHILCGFTKNDAKKMKSLQYIRVLGFNSDGQKILNEVKNKTSVPIITKYGKGYSMLDLELQTSKIYDMFTDEEEEYKKKPIIK